VYFNNKAPVFIYYGLTNYFQNHRHYVNSKDNFQLHGVTRSYEQLQRSCYPYVGDETLNVTYAPCGLVAASMFNGQSYRLRLRALDTVTGELD